MSLLLRVPFLFSPIEGGLAATGRGRKEEGEHLAAVALATLRWVGLRGEREREVKVEDGKVKSERNFSRGTKTLRKTKKFGVFPRQKTIIPMETENFGENKIKPAICPLDLSLHNLMVALIFTYYASFEWGEKMTGFQEQTLFFAPSLFPLFFSRERASVLAKKKIIVLYVGRQIFFSLFLQEEKFLTSDRPVNQRNFYSSLIPRKFSPARNEM